ncbi:oxidoreductase [Agromyces luteolus]|uniref:Aldo/keto reductase n=1 Tax=Agromyces luteolus TaxID=88373 RepID=A0A7C9HJH6_9MICO|nr:aldo/keto reductase [Agromyces luteolus]MUN08607.1 aldo/keto reductase [Agromyces luteolus]GLK27147.1 oxidoreductase [Agromyces luteolus]
MLHERTLGRRGLKVAEIGLGTMGMTAFYGRGGSREEHLRVIRRAHELGVTLFDTAELYNRGNGANEVLLGEAVAPFRESVQLATKFGFTYDANGDSNGRDSSPSNIRRVTENSLRYLGTEVIDVLYQHRQDPAVPVEEVAGAVKELIEEGKVRYFGLSEVGPETLRRAHAVQPVSVVQTEYSLFERGVESEVLPAARELGIGFVPYSPLGRGFLTSAVKPAEQYEASDFRRHDARWQGENYRSNVSAVDRLTALAHDNGVTAAQLALAWLLAQGDDIVPIPGTRSVDRLEENISAAALSLTATELDLIDEIIPDGAVGARYTDEHLPTWV